MALSQSLLPEFDREMPNTRKTLERVPEDKFDWKPHEKSMEMGRLANHLAFLPNWAVTAVNETSIDINPVGEEPLRPPVASTTKELLDLFDAAVTAARAAIAGASDETLLGPWTLMSGGKTVFTMPRIAVLRGFVMNHSIHHRAQLGVYLRLNDIPVPSIYGPSADEGSF